MVGETVSHYEILAKLGEGGMGVVYKARDIRLDRLVCIKVLQAEQLKDESRRKRFIQEAKSASSLNHPISSPSTKSTMPMRPTSW